MCQGVTEEFLQIEQLVSAENLAKAKLEFQKLEEVFIPDEMLDHYNHLARIVGAETR